MSLALFHITLIVLLASILASATCFSVYLVSHKKLMLFAFAGFLFYFFDVAFVFQDEFVEFVLKTSQGQGYLIARSLISIVTGCGFLMSFWLLVCEYVETSGRAIRFVPGAVFVIGSFLMLVLLPQGDTQRFWFYTMREVFVYWIVAYLAICYFATNDEVVKCRLWRHRWLLLLVFVLNTFILVEDLAFFLVLKESLITIGPVVISAERNYAEEALLMCCAVVACRDAYRTLSLRFEHPPVSADDRREKHIAENLLQYGKRYQLSEREQEVLHQVLLGCDNQNIASSMQLALSTVKVHVHNILQKTGRSNRQDLIQDFWKNS